MIPEYVRLNRTYRDIPWTEILEWSKISNLRQIVENKIKEEWIKLIDIRHREIKDQKNDPQKAKLNIFEYKASWWIEYFLTFEDPEDRTIFSLLRLRLPWETTSPQPPADAGQASPLKERELGHNKICKNLPELEWCALIREVHTFWDQLNIWEKGSTFGQHLGFWKRLMEKAENIARKNWYEKMAVIAWVWVRQYYEKRWYNLEGEYMIKKL